MAGGKGQGVTDSCGVEKEKELVLYMYVKCCKNVREIPH